jgi:hypothetical protein
MSKLVSSTYVIPVQDSCAEFLGQGIFRVESICDQEDFFVDFPSQGFA